MKITLPFPPSVNRYYRSPNRGALAGRTLISQEGRAYREAVAALVMESRMAAGMDCQLAVDIEVHMPDKRRRDLDNLTKSLLDSMTHAGVWLDDSQIVDLRIRKAATIGGMVNVTVEAA